MCESPSAAGGDTIEVGEEDAAAYWSDGLEQAIKVGGGGADQGVHAVAGQAEFLRGHPIRLTGLGGIKAVQAGGTAP